MRDPGERRGMIAAALVCVALLCAQAGGSEAIPVKLIGSRIIAKATMNGPAGEVPTHLFIDLGASDPLVLHRNAVEMMGFGSTKQVDLTFASASFRDVPVYSKDDFPEADKVTREHAGELEEVPVTGVMGLGAFGDQVVQLNLPEKEIRFGRLEEMPRSEVAGAIEMDYEATPKGLIVPAEVSDGSRARVMFSTAQFESLAEFAAFEKLKIGTNDAAQVMLGTLDLISYGAYRPSGLKGVTRPLPELVLGTDLLSRFRVTIDPAARKLRFEPVGAPIARPQEQQYLIADRDDDADAIEKFVVENPKSWLNVEAAARLLELRLQRKKGSEEACLKAMELYAASLPIETRSPQMVMVADQILSERNGRGLPALRRALEIASASADKDMNSAAVHQINARKGMLALREGNLKDARRLLLSAAFGTPGDPKLNLWLGEFYEANRQPARAWSRYVEAALAREPPPQAVRYLERLTRDAEFRKEFSVADAELMMEGRLLSFSPTRARKADETASVGLVELFTSTTSKTALGPQLAFDGLSQFYQGKPVVFISYHLDPVMGNAMAAGRLQLYGLMEPQGVVCDGNVIDMTSGDETTALQLFEQYVKKIDGPPPQSAVSLEARADWAGSVLQVHCGVKITPPVEGARDLRLFAVVVERCVFALGGNGIGLHYAVARGGMGDPEGATVDPARTEQAFDLNVNLAALSRRRPSTTAAATAPGTQPANQGPSWMRPGDPDPRELSVALIVQDRASYKVYKSLLVKPAMEGGKQ